MRTVAALFVDPKGPYFAMPGVDCWDEARDATKYAGPHPVVAHPPCNLWVNMAGVNWKRYGRQRPAWHHGGDDGGCFSSALASVRRFGGVLEHPAFSHAWDAHGLAKPTGQGWTGTAYDRMYWTAEIWQSAYGHAARKRTWLLYCGDQPPAEANWAREPGTHQIGWFDRNKPTLSKSAAIQTPQRFADFLVALARGAQDAGGHSRTSADSPHG